MSLVVPCFVVLPSTFMLLYHIISIAAFIFSVFTPFLWPLLTDSGADLGGPKEPRPSLLLNKMFDRKCKNVQNSNKIASNSLKMLEIVFWTIKNSTFSRGACPGKDHHRQPTGYPTLRPLLSKIPGSAPEILDAMDPQRLFIRL